MVATEDSKLLCLPVETLRKIGEEKPEFMVSLVKVIDIAALVKSLRFLYSGSGSLPDVIEDPTLITVKI